MGSELTPEYVATLRRLSGQEKLESAIAFTWAARELQAVSVRQAHPDWAEERVQREVREIFLRASTGSVPLMGVDHTRLTYRHQGRNQRLTDVAGKVIEKALA